MRKAAKRKKKGGGYPSLPSSKPGVSRKFIGGLIGRAGARKRAKAEGLTGKELRKAGRQGFMSGTAIGRGIGAVQGFRANKGMGFKERMKGLAAGIAGGAGNRANAGLAERIQDGYADRLDAMQNPEVPMEMEETDPAMTGAVGGGVDTSAAGAGMDSGGAMAAQRGGLRDRRRRLKQFGGASGVDFRTKDEIKADEKRDRKEARENKREERRTGRKVKKYTRKEGSGQAGLEAYRDKLRTKAKRQRKRKARGQKVRDAFKFKNRVNRRRRPTGGQGNAGCQGKGCGAYE